MSNTHPKSQWELKESKQSLKMGADVITLYTVIKLCTNYKGN